jgi:hypothetical protein
MSSLGDKSGSRRVGPSAGIAIEHETLTERVSRWKHRWLKRVMFDLRTSSSEKCFAYVVVDHLNCVTLDCWPSQILVADKFGWSTKTVHRVSLALDRHSHLRITRNTHGSYRYAPLFKPDDVDKSGDASGQRCPAIPDRNVDQSSLGILINQSSPITPAVNVISSRYEMSRRGLYERELAQRLGNNGFEVLDRLSEFDDAIVERLCRAHADGELGERELLAARLAAEQMPKRRRPI